jgi:hypothetical protein
MLEIQSRASARLDRGKCAVTIEDASARGFEIHAPGMKYTDFGTEFGVFVTRSGEQEMHVFRGRVQAEAVEAGKNGKEAEGETNGSPHSPVSPSRALVLSAHEAIHVTAPDATGKPGRPIKRIAADEKQFVCAILDPFPIFSTGVGLDRGAADSHWEITAVSSDPGFKPQKAVVCALRAGYLADARENAQWIATTQELADMPDHCRWTFRTRFDLRGFDPASARIEGQFTVDDYLVEIRLNGKPLPLPAGAAREDLRMTQIPIEVTSGFVDGINTIEMVVENQASDHRSANSMALCVKWQGSAQRPATKE